MTGKHIPIFQLTCSSNVILTFLPVTSGTLVLFPRNWVGFCDYFNQQPMAEVTLWDLWGQLTGGGDSFALLPGTLAPVELSQSRDSSLTALRSPCCVEAQASPWGEISRRGLELLATSSQKLGPRYSSSCQCLMQLRKGLLARTAQPSPSYISDPQKWTGNNCYFKPQSFGMPCKTVIRTTIIGVTSMSSYTHQFIDLRHYYFCSFHLSKALG